MFFIFLFLFYFILFIYEEEVSDKYLCNCVLVITKL